MSTETIHTHMEFENDSHVDLYLLFPGIYIAFNRIYTSSCPKGDGSLYGLVANFCINGRCDVVLANGKYMIVKENSITLTTVAPDKDFYYPGSLYEGIQVYIDLNNSDIAKGSDFLSLLGTSPFEIKQLFCDKNGVYLATSNEEIKKDIRSIWDMRDEPDIPALRFYLASILRKVMSLPQKSETDAFFTRSQIAIIKEAEHIILSDLSKKHTAKEMADYFGVSESSFKLYIKGILGEGYLPYFRRKRMEKAAELLESTNLKVIDIANAVGYDNQGKFARVFADVYGVSPLEYRRLSK